jgi:hypothetical protein
MGTPYYTSPRAVSVTPDTTSFEITKDRMTVCGECHALIDLHEQSSHTSWHLSTDLMITVMRNLRRCMVCTALVDQNDEKQHKQWHEQWGDFEPQVMEDDDFRDELAAPAAPDYLRDTLSSYVPPSPPFT